MKIYRMAQGTEYDGSYFSNINQNLPSQDISSLYKDIEDDFSYLERALSIPGYTCPNIDNVIKRVNNAEAMSISIQKEDNIESAHSLAFDIEYELSWVENEMEQIRSDNERLRELGVNWHKQAKSCMVKLEELLGRLNNENI